MLPRKHGVFPNRSSLRLEYGELKRLPESARLVAPAHAAEADSLIGCINAKYHFSFWRPVTAIQNGGIDGNPYTIADPNWLPLGTTPNHPEYPAVHGCLTGPLAEVLKAYFGTPNLRISVDSTVAGTTSPHNFNNIREWQTEVELARIYAGFHYHHSLVQGFELGHKVARNVVVNYFRPVRRPER